MTDDNVIPVRFGEWWTDDAAFDAEYAASQQITAEDEARALKVLRELRFKYGRQDWEHIRGLDFFHRWNDDELRRLVDKANG